jgi:hypothetical protein
VRVHRLGAVAVVGLLGILASACADGPRSASGVDDLALPDTVPLPQTLPSLDGSVSDSSQPAATEPATTASAPEVASLPPVAAIDLAPAPPSLRTATFAFTGDTLMHSPLVRQAQRNAGGAGYDFSPMYARVAPILSAYDTAVCHLETPIAPPGEALSTAPIYGVPAEVTTALAGAGYDRCSTASNHSMDRGAAGVDATVTALEAAGVAQAGMARTPEEAITRLFDVNGITVAHISDTFSLNGLRRPADQPWRVGMIDDGLIIDAGRDARARGADVVILSLHWGTEGRSEPDDYQRDVANWVTASGAVDLVIGTHAHVPQPIEMVNGRWVAFGLGNFISNMPLPNNSWPASSQDGVIVGVTIAEQPDGTFLVERPTVTPTWVDRDHGWVIRPVVADLADPTVAEPIKTLLRQSLARTTATYGDLITPSG